MTWLDSLEAECARLNYQPDRAWCINYQSFAGYLCPLCAQHKPVVYFGDGSGYQGYMHKVSDQTLLPCKAQAVQRRLHPV